jgi:hypothetical protein
MLDACASTGVLPPEEARQRTEEGERRPALDLAAPPIVQALAMALNAPSPHNTQPWLFHITSPMSAELRVDPQRLLPKTDPPARQIHIGCGCLVEAFHLSAGLLARGAEVVLFPEGPYGPEDIGVAPVARLSLTQEEAQPSRLAPYIFSRQTSRLAYEGNPIDTATFARVLEVASPSDSKVTLVPSATLPAYLALLMRAMEIEANTVAVNEETRRWFRFSSDEAETSRDGLTFEAVGLSGMSVMFARWFTDDTQESWNAPGTIEEGLSTFREGLESARGLVLLTTENNTVLDQVNAGRDCYRFMLALTEAGYFCHPTNQILQEYPEMEGARRDFEAFAQIKGPAKVQMIFRVGQSATPFRSYRRNLHSFLGRQENQHA